MISTAGPATGITPAMCMRLIGIGSQYLMQEEFAAIKAKPLA